MGRQVSFDFATGGGSIDEFLMGDVEIEATLIHEVGTRVVLPDPVTIPLINGKAVHPDMAISPAGPEPEWAYRFTIRSGTTRRAWSELRGVPDGVAKIDFKDLTKFTTVIPPRTTAGMMQNWADTTEANAARSEAAADRAEAPTDVMVRNVAGVRKWATGVSFAVGDPVMMPWGDIMLATMAHTAGTTPNMLRFAPVPEAGKARYRARAEIELATPGRAERASIPVPFSANWDAPYPIFKAGGKYFTSWKAENERNPGGTVRYAHAGVPNFGDGTKLATVTTAIPAGKSVTSMQISAANRAVPATYKLALIHNGEFLGEMLIGLTAEIASGATSIAIASTIFPMDVPAGTDVVVPRSGDLSNFVGQTFTGPDTIVLLDRVRAFNRAFPTPLTVSANIESALPGGSWITSAIIEPQWAAGPGGTWVSDLTSSVSLVVDMSVGDTGYEYDTKATAAEVQNSPGSWHSGPGLPTTVATLDGKKPSYPNILPLSSANHFSVAGGTSPIRVYLRNITLIGGGSGAEVLGATSSEVKFIRDNVRILWGGIGNETHDPATITSALRVRGNVTSLAENCLTAHAGRDCQSYTENLGRTSRALEVESGGHSAGMLKLTQGMDLGSSDNISTQHMGGAVIRVGGVYHGSQGQMIADVQPGTVSLNFGVTAYGSESIWEGYRGAFGAQQSGCEMWLIGCRAWGNPYDLIALEGTTVHVWDTEFDTTKGIEFMDIVNPL